MAACAITIGGTSGTVQINYILGGVAHTMNGSFGETIYINDAATSITSASYGANNPQALADSINALNDPRIRAVAMKTTSTSTTREMFIVLKITSSAIPQLRINNVVGNHKLFMKGTVSGSCIPAGYTEIESCIEILP